MTHKITGTVSNHGGVSYRIRAFRADTGAYLAESMSDTGDGTYTVNLTYTDAVMATMDRDYGQPWKASTQYALDSLAIPTSPNAHFYKVTDGPAGDPNFSSVVSLLHFDGSDASTTFTDVTGKTWTAFGNAQIDTAQSKFGGASGLFDGTGDYINTPHHSDFNLESGDFTVEAWVRRAASGASHYIMSKRQDSPSQSGYEFRINSNNTLQFFFTGVGGATVTSSGTVPSGQWVHVAITRSGNTFRLFIDGTQDGSATVSNGTSNTFAPRIGIAFNDTGGFNGWIDDFRITKGVARYTANFTPPSTPFPNGEFGGLSGTTEPTWPTTGGNVVDNEITWTDQGEMSIPRIEGPVIPVPV